MKHCPRPYRRELGRRIRRRLPVPEWLARTTGTSTKSLRNRGYTTKEGELHYLVHESKPNAPLYSTSCREARRFRSGMRSGKPVKTRIGLRAVISNFLQEECGMEPDDPFITRMIGKADELNLSEQKRYTQ